MSQKKSKRDTIYACTSIEIRREVDDWKHGCQPDTSEVLRVEQCNIVGGSLKGLIQNIGAEYAIDMDDVWIAEDPVKIIGYNRLENADGDQPTAEQKKQWKKGKFTLYLTDYTFAIEKRVINPIAKSEFGKAGIKTHD